MEQLKAGMIVKNTAGHDGDKFVVVLSVEPDGYALVVDGKRRKIEKPKRKNPRHLQRTNSQVCLSGITDKQIRKALRPFNSGQSIAEESE